MGLLQSGNESKQANKRSDLRGARPRQILDDEAF